MSKIKEMILTAVGPDQPGRVRQISAFIHDAGCNLEDSRMAVLAGEFALIVLFSGEEAAIAKIHQNREKLEADLGYQISLTDTARRAQSSGLTYELRVGGVDQKGIVLAVSQVLAEYAINILSFDSKVSPAAFSGTPMYSLTANLKLESRSLLASLRNGIEKVCDEKNLSYSLEALDLN